MSEKGQTTCNFFARKKCLLIISRFFANISTIPTLFLLYSTRILSYSCLQAYCDYHVCLTHRLRAEFVCRYRQRNILTSSISPEIIL